MELKALFRTCWRRKWIIMAFTVLLPLMTLGVCLSMTKVYEGVAKVKIQQLGGTETLLQRQIPQEWGLLDHVSGIPTVSEAEVMRSRMVVQPVIEKLNLRRRVTPIDQAQKALGLIDEYRDEFIRLEKFVEPGFVGAFLQRRQLVVEPLEDSDIIEVYAYSDVLEEARDIANEVALSYAHQAGLLKKAQAAEALRIVEDNLQTAEQDLGQTQNELKRFKEAHNVADLAKRIEHMQRELTDLEGQRIAVRSDLTVRRNRLEQLSREKADPSRLQVTLASVEGYPHVQDLQRQLLTLESSLSSVLSSKRPEHPEVIELTAQVDSLREDLRREILRLLENEITELAMKDELLAASIEDTKGRLSELATTDRALADLERAVQMAESRYLNLQAERDGVRVAAATDYGNAAVITAAALPDPTDPYYPEPALYVILAIFVGLLFGFGMAFVVDYMDISLRSPEAIEEVVDLPVLGSIRKSRRARKVWRNGKGPITGAMGSIVEVKQSLLHQIGDAQVVAACSALRREGKTTLLSHLAVSLAQGGKRVALADLNLRRPRIHKIFRVPNGGGVAELLRGDVESLDSVLIYPRSSPNLGVLKAGSRSRELVSELGSEAVAELVDVLRSRHDYVLLDAAAASDFAGGPVVAALADRAVLVVSVGGPSKEKLTEALTRLRAAGADLAGVVVNRV